MEFQEILRELGLSEFVALDIETTGLDYEREDIIEVGAVLFREGEPYDSFNEYVKPTKHIPPQITRITGISDTDVQNAPAFAEVLPGLLQFVAGKPLVAHNVRFDLPFLEYHARKVRGDFVDWDGRRLFYHYFPNQKIDTVVLARLFLYFLPTFSLSTLARYFQIPQKTAHRALPDAEVAGKIFLELLPIALRLPFRDVQRILQILEPTDEPIKTFFEQLARFLASGGQPVEAGLDRETFTISTHFYNIIGEDEVPESSRLEVEPIDEEEIAHFFSEGGEFAREFAGFETRLQQMQMARAVASAFNEQKFLVVEAGTGTGKSLAYLLPAIKWATRNYGPFGRVVVSTNTKNLQEQLFFKDLPILHSILKERFKAVLLKGKANYLCLDKWFTVMKDMEYRLSEYERARMLPLYLWVQQTQTGDISENNAFQVERNLSLWSKFIAENNYCPGKACKYYDKCFLMRARNHARNAHLVLVNHSLLFSDLAADQAILSDYVNVIFDEAHNIEKTATEYLGVEATFWQFRDFFNKLYQKEKVETGVLVQLKRRLQLGSNRLPPAHTKALMNILDRLIPQVENARQAASQFFKQLTGELREKIPIDESESEYLNQRFRYTRADQIFEPLMDVYSDLIGYLKKIQSELNNLIEYFRDLPDDSFEFQRQLYQELNAQFMQADLLVNNLEFLVAAEWDNYVYWFELPARADSQDTRLYAAPLDVAGILAEKLYSKLNTAVFTSATLAVNQSFDYFIRRVGLNLVPPERLETLLLDSPFNYDEQVLLAVPSFIADPKHPDYLPNVKTFIEKLVSTLPRGTLVLFTSYSMLNSVYQAVKFTFDAENVPLFGQGIDGSRHAIINQFKEIERSFLFGTDSFWEGVDVPGSALEILLITRLPFDVPSDPIIQAKAELIRKQGGNPFMDFTIPEAVIRLRQGFGRLIRHKSDYGAIIILDTRVIKKMYGRIFLRSLPLHATVFTDEEEFWQRMKHWFGEE